MDQEQEQPSVIPVIEEELVAETREVPIGSVRVSKQVEQIRKVVTAPSLHDVVHVNRVPVNRVIESIPKMREEGDLLIIPVVEEELVVQKRLVLREEIHIRRRRTRQNMSKDVTLERESAVVERLDADGNVIARSAPGQTARTAAPRRAHGGLLK